MKLPAQLVLMLTPTTENANHVTEIVKLVTDLMLVTVTLVMVMIILLHNNVVLTHVQTVLMKLTSMNKKSVNSVTTNVLFVKTKPDTYVLNVTTQLSSITLLV